MVDAPSSRMTRVRETPFHMFLTILSDVVFRAAAHMADGNCFGNTLSPVETVLMIASRTLVDVQIL